MSSANPERCPALLDLAASQSSALQEGHPLPRGFAGAVLRIPQGFATLVRLEELAGVPAWREALSDKCKDHRFYELIVATLTNNFDYHFIVLEDDDRRIRAIQPVFLVRQNLTEGVTGVVRRAVDGVRGKFPRFLTLKTLFVGCTAGEGHLGTCRPEDAQWTAEALQSCLRTFARAAGAPLIVLKDFSARYRDALAGLSAHGFTRIASMPMTRLALSYANFEAYVASLGSATRKNLRRKYRATAQRAPITCEVLGDVTPVIDEIYPLYLAVYERSKLHFEKLTPAYFCGLGREMPERVRFFVWRQEGRAIAFSLCLVHDGVIYDDYLGLEYAVAFDLHLYFFTFRDILTWALAQGLHSYCSSPLNYEPKLHLGCELMPLDLYVMHTAKWLNPIFRRALRFLQPTKHDPVLKRFRNAHEL